MFILLSCPARKFQVILYMHFYLVTFLSDIVLGTKAVVGVSMKISQIRSVLVVSIIGVTRKFQFIRTKGKKAKFVSKIDKKNAII